jgi:FlaG/FlaF family flagellin (archaellin)
VNTKNFTIFLAATLAVFNLQSQTTVSTPVVGFSKSSFSSGTTGLGVGFIKPDVYTGVASAVSASTLSVTGASFGSYGPVGGLPVYYIEIKSGPLVGYVADIVSNTGTTLTLAANLASISGTTPSFTIRPHQKVSNLFAGNSSLSDYVDTVILYNADGSSTSLLRDSSSATGWVDPVAFTAADAIVYPGQAFLLNAAGSGAVTFTGVVKTTPTLIPLYANAVNFVTAGNPSVNPALQTSGIGNNLAGYVDTVATFLTDGSFGEGSNFLWAGAPDGFIDPVSFSAVTGANLPGTGAILVNVSADTTWKAPAPYTP